MVEIVYIDAQGSKTTIDFFNSDHLDKWLLKQGMRSLRRGAADGPEVDFFPQLVDPANTTPGIPYYPGPELLGGTIATQQAVDNEAEFPSPKRHKTDMPPMPNPPPDHFNWDETKPPKFLCRDEWFNGILNTIDAFLPSCETDENSRIPPLAISRCSRGGKTRSLHEIALEVQRKSKEAVNSAFVVNVVFVSFNGNITPVRGGETPLCALTRRIAFALSDVEKVADNFDRMFRPLEVSEEQVLEWLENRNWLLLIDELNKFDLRSSQVGLRAENARFAEFLKLHFLVKEGRYFVFSTHEMSTGYALCNFMENNSDRGAKVKPLPLIPSLGATLQAFGHQMHDKGKFNPRLAVYCGLVPGLIYLETCYKFPTTRRKDILDTFLERGPTDKDMVVILETVLEGEYESFLDYPELLQLADTTELTGGGEGAKVRWIPHHLVYLLAGVAKSQQRAKVSENMRDHLRKICELFVQFREAKTQSGEGWEALFVLLVLIRVLTRKGSDLLNLSEYVQSNPQTDYCVEFNSPIEMPGDKTFDAIEELEELLDCIDKATVKEAAIGIYFPTHASFEQYDVIVVKWGRTGGILQRFGYQLKEGAEIPKMLPAVSVIKASSYEGSPHRRAIVCEIGRLLPPNN